MERLIERRWIVLFVALCAGWLGVNAVWGLTGPDDTLVSGWMRLLAPPSVWLTGAFLVLAVLWTVSRRSSTDNSEASGFVVVLVGAYLGGVTVFEALYNALRPFLGSTGVPASTLMDGFRFALHRSFVLMPAIPMLLAWRVASSVEEGPVPFRIGDWSARTKLKLPLLGHLSWSGAFLLFAFALALPVFLGFQMQVEFAPVTSGALLRLAPALFLMILTNGTVEEILFRGFFLRSLVPATGVRAAVWIQAIFFGLHHFGSSPTPMSALLTTLGATLVGYMWGRSVVGTGGLGWAIVTHMLADLTFFSVTHVSW